MAYGLTIDERYIDGVYSYSAGYYDASNVLNEIFVIAENSTAYGTNSNIYSTADIDTTL